MYEYMPTDNQFKDDLRIQRDDWEEIVEYLDNSGIEDNTELERAKRKANKVLSRINESLQD